MTEYQSEVVVGKLREAESLLLGLIEDNPKVDSLHDAKIHIWKAMDQIAKAANV